MHKPISALSRAAVVLVAVVLAGVGLNAAAQVRCTMPNGVVITQQLGDCPKDAVAVTRLDGEVAPERAAPQAVVPASSVVAPAAVRGESSRPALPVASQSEGLGGLSLGNWVIVIALAGALFWAIKGSAGTSGPERYCTTCGHVGPGRTNTKGSLLIEIVLWLCLFVPGLVYSLWRHSSRHKVCVACGGAALVPLGSPVAQAARRSQSSEDRRG